MNEITIKPTTQQNFIQQLYEIGFDEAYAPAAQNKYHFHHFKIFNLSSPALNILKQTALSCGTDCAVHRDVITCKAEHSDCILTGNTNQLKNIAKKLQAQPFGLKKVAELLNAQLKHKLEPLTIRNSTFDWEKETYLMGILNLTPDSFSDGGCFNDFKKALSHATTMIADGADIIDIGAESTRPNSHPVPPDEEQKRLLPILKEIRNQHPNIPISIDTRNASTALAAIESGADIINDVSFGEYDSEMLTTAAKLNCPYILTHTQGTPDKMQINPHYENVTEEIYKKLYTKIEVMKNIGIARKNIIVDIGLGFGKTTEHNFELMRHLKDFKGLQHPLLVGHSRKSFLQNFNENTDETTATISTFLALNGANILRTHDVKRNKNAIEIAKRLKQR